MSKRKNSYESRNIGKNKKPKSLSFIEKINPWLLFYLTVASSIYYTIEIIKSLLS